MSCRTGSFLHLRDDRRGFGDLRHYAAERCPQRDISRGNLLSVAGIFLTLHAEFLAGVQVIVYVGGILVLFVFVIMLIAVERSRSRAPVQPAVDDCADYLGAF